MKLLLIGIAVVIVCVVLFVAGVVSPRRSKRMQSKVDRFSKKGERRGDRDAGKLGDMTRDALERSRKAADASAAAGRSINEKVSGRQGN